MFLTRPFNLVAAFFLLVLLDKYVFVLIREKKLNFIYGIDQVKIFLDRASVSLCKAIYEISFFFSICIREKSKWNT